MKHTSKNIRYNSETVSMSILRHNEYGVLMYGLDTQDFNL